MEGKMEEKTEIKPAIDVLQVPIKMSGSEFRQKLYVWFEDQGLISDLRAHLRRQMIEALKQTSMGRKIANLPKQIISPKLQVLNLLIAEFLLQRSYHYSLSVFTTEAPMLGQATQFSTETIQWRFNDNQIWDVLECLAILQTSDLGQEIFNLYQQEQNPLLLCIIKVLQSNYNNVQGRPIHTSDQSIRDLRSILESSNLTVEQMRVLTEAFRRTLNKERAKIIEEVKPVTVVCEVKEVQVDLEPQNTRYHKNDVEMVSTAIQVRLSSNVHGMSDANNQQASSQNQIEILRNYIKALLQENTSLRTIISRQQTKINELSQEAARLATVNNRAVKNIYTDRTQKCPKSTVEVIRNQSKALLNMSNTSDDLNDSATIHILEEAKERLKDLEKESAKVDRLYHKFCSKYESDGVARRHVEVVSDEDELKSLSSQEFLDEELSLSKFDVSQLSTIDVLSS